MKRIKTISLICLPLWLAVTFVALPVLPGCASFGKFTVSGASKVLNAVTVAQGLLHTLDSFYDKLVELKLVPDYTQQATRALAMADNAAVWLRAIIAGATVDDAQLNILAGQVVGAQAILTEIKINK